MPRRRFAAALVGLLALAGVALGVALWVGGEARYSQAAPPPPAQPKEPSATPSDLARPSAPQAAARAARAPRTASVDAAAEPDPEPRGARVVVRIEAPAITNLEAFVSLLDEEPTRFLENPTWRLRPDALEQHPVELDPRGDESDGAVMRAVVRLAEVPAGRPLAVLVASNWYPREREVPSFEPVAFALPPLAEGETLELPIVLEPAGCVTGRVLDALGEPVADVFVRVEGGADGHWAHTDGRFYVNGLASGLRRIELFASGEGWMQRTSVEAHVVDGQRTDLGDVRLPAGDAELFGRAVDDAGQPVRGEVTASVRGARWGAVDTGEDGSFRLVGAVQEIDHLAFEPLLDFGHLPAETDVAWPAPAGVDILVPRREEKLVVVLFHVEDEAGRAVPEPWFCALTGTRGIVLAHERRRRTIRVDDVLARLLPPGEYELTAWAPEAGLGARFAVSLPANAKQRRLQVPLQRTGTVVRGELELLSLGDPVGGQAALIALPDGTLAEGDVWDGTANPFYVPSGPFELRGLPAGVTLELRFSDENRNAVRRTVTLSRGEELDLGKVTIEVP